MITPKQAFAHRPDDWFPLYQNVRVEQVFSPGGRFTQKFSNSRRFCVFT